MAFDMATFYEKHKNGFKVALGASTLFAMMSYRSYMLNKTDLTFPVSTYTELEDMTLDDLHGEIYSSEKLTSTEKDLLYNEEFLEDILPYVNDSTVMKYIYSKRFNDFDVASYGPEDEMYGTTKGYYDGAASSTLHVANYDETDRYDDVISHEYVHLCQYSLCPDFILEPVAELMSCEYFGCRPNSYLKEIKLLKELMEIIGSKPILAYAFSGDFSLIEERVKPHLTRDEYVVFLECIKSNMDFNHGRKSEDYDVDAIAQILEPIYDTLYMNIYGEDISNNPIISAYRSGHLVYRHYFNHRLTNEYYLDYDNLEPQIIPVMHMLDDGTYDIRYDTYYLPTRVYIDPISTVDERFEEGITK